MLEVFEMSDQPVSCPYCQVRAEIAVEFLLNDLEVQLCICQKAECGLVFLVEQPDGD